MKKWIFSIMAFAALSSVAFFASERFNQGELTLAQLENIEALAQGETGGSQRPCDNFNGYRRIQEGNEKIYDCCYKEQVGKGKNDCKRW